MIVFLPFQAPAPAPQVQSQPLVVTMGDGLPPAMDALIKAKNWAGLADWFESVPPATRGKYYEWWIQALNRSQRWERLVVVCEALQPQLEAKSGPRLSTYRIYRASALGQLGRHGEAALAQAENGRLGLAEGLPNACTEARLAQDWDALLAYAGELLTKTPDNAGGLAWKGEALARMDRLAEAEPLLQAAVAKDPKIAYAWNNLGRCLNERKAWGEAREALDKALALEPNQLEALFNRGRCLFELKHYRESRDDFRAALSLRPEDPVLAENLRQAERYAALPEPKKPAVKKKR
jgi:tetratricopeptide (TPR) repeat protein